MPSAADNSILQESLEKLSISDELKSAIADAGCKNLQEVLSYDGDTLLKKKGFNYHNITELIQILSKHGLKNLFRD